MDHWVFKLWFGNTTDSFNMSWNNAWKKFVSTLPDTQDDEDIDDE